jgi:ATP-dependent DNA helicase RecQ
LASAGGCEGTPDPRLERSGLASTKTFGALAGKNEDWLLALLRRCVTAGWIDFTTDERPVVLLTPAGKAVLFAQGPVRFLLPPEHSERVRGRSSAAGARKRRQVVVSTNPEDTALFEALRARRLELARAEGMPPYVVASDRTLRELAEVRPVSIAQLQGIYGIGPAKAARYGEALLNVVKGAALGSRGARP